MRPGPTELEQEWLRTDDDPRLAAILTALGGTSPRKYRLAACACCRQVWGTFTGPARLVVEYAERYAEGEIPYTELCLARDACSSRRWGFASWGLCHQFASQALSQTLENLPGGGDYPRAIRDVFGNPFRPVSLEPYRTHKLVALAQSMYDESAFERMDILADALEDAGCGDPVVLDHCRGGGGHWRGCWVIDGILGKQ